MNTNDKPGVRRAPAEERVPAIAAGPQMPIRERSGLRAERPVPVVDRQRMPVRETRKTPSRGAGRPAPRQPESPCSIRARGGLSRCLIAIGASTGGTDAIRAVIQDWPADMPPVVIVQHMPGGFTASFAARLDSICAACVVEAEDGQRLLPGHVYIAPGGSRHMQIVGTGRARTIRLVASDPVNRHRPSVDVMFQSLADTSGAGVIAVLLTGMGADGARGMQALHAAGATTIAQDRETSVVYGMPGNAVALGGVDYELAIQAVGPRIVSLLRAVTRQDTSQQ